jgi:hypothetical protein
MGGSDGWSRRFVLLESVAHTKVLLSLNAGNIEDFDGGYYQKCTLSYTLGANEELWKRLAPVAGC